MSIENNKLWTAASFLKVFDDFQKIIAVDKDDPLLLTRTICEIGPSIISTTLGVPIEEVKKKSVSSLVCEVLEILTINIESLKQMNRDLKRINELRILN